MAEWFAQQGHEVRVICAPPYYPEWSVADGYCASRFAKHRLNEVRVRRCPVYVPKQPRTLNRLLHLASFALSSLPPVLKQI